MAAALAVEGRGGMMGAGSVPRCILDRVNGGEGGFSWAATALSALWRGKFLETPVAGSAVNAGFKLRAVPQATASLANFQVHAQIHD
jgi:hypothetical protein